MLSRLSTALTVWALAAAAAKATNTTSRTTVRTPTGIYVGQINNTFPNVREFLSVPFGLDTSGAHRWLPPRAVPLSSKTVDTRSYPPACPQYVGSAPNVFNQQIPQYLQYWGNDNLTAGESAKFTSEDCLKLAIWTPANATAASTLPVALFWTGGAFLNNGVLVPAQLPPTWIAETQAHIVVTINYRMNIMGFPNAAGLADNNLALMDMRLSLEWVRDNIAHFGGDASRIVVWGQSSGSRAVDLLHYAYWDDPIAHGFFSQSGNSLDGYPWRDNSDFTSVAQKVGCDFPDDATAELECMRKVDYNDIINVVGRAGSNYTWKPVADERLVFRNNTRRYEEGFVARVPMIYSTVANEGASLAAYPANDPVDGFNQTAGNLRTFEFLCGAARSTILRNQNGWPPTYRYQYAGNWSNEDPLPWMGAYHSSDLVMLMATYREGSRPCCEPLEVETSRTMGRFLLSFLQDPWTGPQKLGWLPTDTTAENGGLMLRFGANGKAVQNVTTDEVVGTCFGEGEYDPFP